MDTSSHRKRNNTLIEESKKNSSSRVVKSARKESSFDKVPHVSNRYQENILKEKFKHVHDFVLFSFKRLLYLWYQHLSKEAPDKYDTEEFKKDLKIYEETYSFIKPLFKHLSKRSLPEEILSELSSIASHLERQEYSEADNCYIRISVGNAPWPMGVMSVGIHARKAQERIHSNQVSRMCVYVVWSLYVIDILNDETQRKFVQSVKRLISFSKRINLKD